MHKKYIVAAILTASMLLPAAGALAQTSTSTTTTPGAPNTGAGGDATQNLILLGVSGFTALAGMTYLISMRKNASHSNH